MDDLLRPLGLALLPVPLEDFALRGEVEALRAAGRVVPVDPPRVSYGRLVRLPQVAAEILAQTQARRLVKAVRRRGDRPAVVVIFEPEQYLIARAVLSRVEGTELWYRPTGTGGGDPRVEDLDSQAAARAALTLEGGPPSPEVFERLRATGLSAS